MATKIKSGVFFVPINQIKANRKNPRIIKDDKFEKLVKSIQEFPEMLEKRPLVCFTDTDGKFVVLGGNMRLKASQAAGLSELPITLADDWTEEKKAEFLIKDNVSFGEWSFVDLQDWDTGLLDDWGFDASCFFVDEKKDNIKSKENNGDINFKDCENDYIKKLISITTERNNIYRRNPVNFLSIRSLQIKDFKLLKEIKLSKDVNLIDFISKEVTFLLKSIFNNFHDFVIISAPKGTHTKNNNNFHFAGEICKKIANNLNIEFIEDVFQPTCKGTYGGNNKKLLKENISNKIIFFDDIITTGTTLLSCLKYFESAFIIPVVYIYNIM